MNAPRHIVAVQPVEHIPGETWHARRDGPKNAFRYGVDYVLIEPEAEVPLPRLFRRNAAGVVTLQDRDHGGAPGDGRGVAWVRERLVEHIPAFAPGRILLLAQPRVLGHVFNPVSFWLIHDRDDALCVVIAEVTNTYGDRHSYLCHRDDLAPIAASDRLEARKALHVSPFQPIAGGYAFNFDIRPERIAIRIELSHPGGGMIATLTGPRVPLTSLGLLRAMVRRPFGARRVLALIHWQAIKLWWKGAGFRNRPEPPGHEISR